MAALCEVSLPLDDVSLGDATSLSAPTASTGIASYGATESGSATKAWSPGTIGRSAGYSGQAGSGGGSGAGAGYNSFSTNGSASRNPAVADQVDPRSDIAADNLEIGPAAPADRNTTGDAAVTTTPEREIESPAALAADRNEVTLPSVIPEKQGQVSAPSAAVSGSVAALEILSQSPSPSQTDIFQDDPSAETLPADSAREVSSVGAPALSDLSSLDLQHDDPSLTSPLVDAVPDAWKATTLSTEDLVNLHQPDARVGLLQTLSDTAPLSYSSFSEAAVAEVDLTAVPEPSTFALAGLALVGLAAWKWRGRARRSA
jgi:hypothetical protein